MLPESGDVKGGLTVDDTNEPVTDQSGDWEYDMAHDEIPPADVAPTQAEPSEPTSVPGGPADSDGDYQYDLAHDIPKG
jgi:hypothetical protein